MQENIIVSIISVVYNDPEIEATIKSIIPFLSEEVELVLIDGGSNTETLSVIEKYRSYFSFYLSEKDKGIYDAMNKALAHARGRFLLHMNSGDTLLELPLEELREDKTSDIISYPVSINNNEMIYYPLFDFRSKFRTSLHHQGTFYKNGIVVYDTSYKIFSDYDLNQRLYKQRKKCILHVSPIVSNHLENGVSAKTPKRRIEYSHIIKKNFGWTYVIVFYFHLVLKVLTHRRY
jgi:glycosyltransferase involved in cell wall biosynthesis